MEIDCDFCQHRLMCEMGHEMDVFITAGWGYLQVQTATHKLLQALAQCCAEFKSHEIKAD